jgi:hypothetical protein
VHSGNLGAYLFDERDQGLACPFEVGSSFSTSERRLFAGDFGVRGDGCELSVNSILELGDRGAELLDLGQKLSGLLVAEDRMFSQRVAAFRSSEHPILHHAVRPRTRRMCILMCHRHVSVLT